MKPDAASLKAYEDRAAAQQQAARLFPRDYRAQAEWLRAMAVVRGTTRGYVFDRPLFRETCNVN